MAPNQYAIGVAKNKFALFDSEEEIDPHEILKQQEKEKEERKKAKVVEKASVVKSSRKLNSNVGKVVGKSSEAFQSKDAVRSRQSYPPVARKPASSNDNVQSFQKHSFEEPTNHVYADRRVERVERTDHRPEGSSGSESGAPERGRGGRGFSRVFVRGGGGRGRGFGYDGRIKREYDRHSGSDRTGVKPVEKRKAGGPHNWGNQQDDFYNEDVPQEEPKGQGEPPESDTKAEPDDAVKEDEAPSPQEEAEKPALTLDEWKALKTSKPRPSYNIRQPGEGEDLSRWKKMYALSKKTETDEEEEEYEYGEFPQRVGRQKRLEIDVRFYDRRGRGRGRGSFRGFPGKSYDNQPGRSYDSQPGRSYDDQPGRSYDNQTTAPAPRVDDEADFPSLVKGSN